MAERDCVEGGATVVVPCPTCGKPVAWHEASRWRPFCSQCCRLIDLGAWIEGSHRIPGEPGDEPPLDSIPGEEEER
jgi:endogenous inhibitor of DNA gyrase (YacG/DUF329 family)